MLSQRRIKKRLEYLQIIIFQFKEFAHDRGYFIPGIFLPWYIWSLLFYPELVLWWLVTTFSFMLVSVCFIRPRSILFWLISCIFLFNNIQIFKLPWPYIKMSYIGVLAVCFAAIFGVYAKRDNEKQRIAFSTDYIFFFACLFIAGLLGALSQFSPNQLASIEELKIQLRVIPFINQEDNFISMRYLWVWCCGISLYWAMLKLIKTGKDIKVLLWSIQWFSLPVSLFGIYSYAARKYMVDFYIYERRINSTFSSPAVLADIFTVIIIFGIYLFLRSKSRFFKLILALLLLLQFTAIVLSGCRANLIVLALFGFVWFIIYTIKNILMKRWKTIVILCIVVMSMIIAVYQLPKISYIKNIPVVKRAYVWKNSIISKHNFLATLLEGRKWHWECGINMMKSSPLWGVGCGRFEQEYSRFRVYNDMFTVARAHNVPLRILSEGGAVTLISFFIVLILTAFRLSRSFFRSAREAAPEWSGYLQIISVGFLAIFILSLFSDILLVREECVFFMAVISACASRSYSKLPPFDKMKYLSIRKMWSKAERRVQRAFRTLGWGYLGKVRLSSILKIILYVTLFILFIIGVSNIRFRRAAQLKSGELSCGFYTRVPAGTLKHNWRSMGMHAVADSTITKDVFYFGYRAVNERMAVSGFKLRTYINGVLTATFPLNSTESRWVYYDMTSLKGQHVKIEFKTEKVFVPFKEHWFADNYSYGAVITKPIWINMNSNTLVKIKKGLWIKYEE